MDFYFPIYIPVDILKFNDKFSLNSVLPAELYKSVGKFTKFLSLLR